MDIFEILKADHQKVSGLFVKIEQTKNENSQERKTLFSQLREELVNHTEIEEKVFYSELRMYEQTKDIVSHSVSEHNSVRDLLQIISETSFGSSEWLLKINELRAEVEHHVEEEEIVLFKKAHEVLSKELIKEMGISFKIEKDKILEKAAELR